MNRSYYSFLMTVVLLLGWSSVSTAQLFTGKDAQHKISGTEVLRYKANLDYPAYIQFQKGKEIPTEKLTSWLQQSLGLCDEITFAPIRHEVDAVGMKHQRYQQLWKGTPIKAGVLITHERNGMIQSINGDVFNAHVDNGHFVSPTKALQLGLNVIDADLYKGLQHKVRGVEALNSLNEFETPILKIVPRNLDYKTQQFRLAYEVILYALEPLQRVYLYIDAETGTVVAEENRLCTVDTQGTAVTKYVGTVTITTDSVGPNNFLLQESGRGGGIITRDDNNGGAVFGDTDNYWDNVNAAQDEVATDAHYGAEVTYDYFFIEHGRNSYDNLGSPLISNVHNGTDFANAFWDGSSMTYGDGNPNSIIDQPLTTLDVCGHEISHGVTEFTAGLIYANESGAINESFSDIFGNVIEGYGGSLDWRVGEFVTSSGLGIRNMADPIEFDNPDTYMGDGWDPFEEVHDNSGVQNFWFYLLAEGGTGVNDNGDAYTVNALGIDVAAQIAYRNLSVYLTPSSDYADARFYAIQSATDLFGGCSTEAMEVANAWYAVGVGLEFTPDVNPGFSANNTKVCEVPGPVSFSAFGLGIQSYYWDFGDGVTSTLPNPTHSYTQLGEYDVKLVVEGCNGDLDSLTQANFISVDPTNSFCDTTVMDLNNTIRLTSCEGVLTDPGGNGDYFNDMNSLVVIDMGSSDVIEVKFTDFNVESGYDQVILYDGDGIAAPVIGTYSGNGLPDGGAPIIATGGTITIQMTSDYSVTYSGFVLDWKPTGGSQAPVANFTFPSPASANFDILFEDQSTAGGQWLWDFGDGGTSMLQDPVHQYATAGTYDVTLYTQNCFGTDTLTQSIVIDGPTQMTINPDSLCVTLNQGETALLPVTVINGGTNTGYFQENGALLAGPVEETNTVIFTMPGETTSHLFTDIPINIDTLKLSVLINGDYDAFDEEAEIYIEGNLYQVINDNNVPNGTDIIVDLVLTGGQLGTWLIDGELDIKIVNSAVVDPTSGGSNLHEVTISYEDFSWLDLSELEGNLPANSQSVVDVLFDATDVVGGTYTYNAPIATNDPNNPTEYIYCKLIVNAPSYTVFIADSTSTCDGIVEFTDFSANEPISWAWDFGDGNSSTQQSPTHAYTANGTYDVELITCNAIGCDTLTQLAYINVDFDNPLCNATLIPNGSTVTVTDCSGYLFDPSGPDAVYENNVNGTIVIQPAGAVQVELTFTLFELENGFDYLSIYDGPDINSPLIGTYSDFTLPNGGTVISTGGAMTLVMTTDGSVVYEGFEASWNCIANVAPTAGYNFQSACDGAVSFTDASLYAASWDWDFGDGTGTSTQQNPTYTYGASGSYQVELTVTNATGTDTYTETVVVELIDAIVNIPATTDVGLATDFTDNTVGAVTWAWDFGDGTTSTLPSPTYAYTAAGTYTVSLTVVNSQGCSETITQDIEVRLVDGLLTPTATFEFSLYPNPSNGLVYLAYETTQSNEMQIQVYNSLGQQVVNQAATTANRIETSIDLSNYPSGIYFFKLRVGDKFSVKKVLVE